MGLIKAFVGAAGGTMADQWKEFFYCESIPKDVLMVRGVKQIGRRSSNTKSNDNIISNGSGIAVADGQCMIIVEQGKIVEICSEPGEYTFDKSTEPSIFTENLGKGIKDMFHTMKKRFAYGGDTGKDQRVYYFNMKELVGNKFGTAAPIPFRVVDKNINLDIDVSVRCFGVYSYKIANPILFYTNVCGNVKEKYERSEIDDQLRGEFVAALQPGFAVMSELGLRPNQIIAHGAELQDAMNKALTEKWIDTRGLEIVAIAISSITLPPEDAERIKVLQQSAALKDPALAGATLVGAQAEAMKAAASNSAGAVTGLMGVGLVNGMGSGNAAQSLYNMASENEKKNAQAGGWKCSCGTMNTGKFCTECGKQQDTGWKCSCGTTNIGKFCTECGKPKPSSGAKCPKCGWTPADTSQMSKFCPECGTQMEVEKK